MAWTTPKTWAAAAILTAAELNIHIRDNQNALAPDGATSASWTPDLVTAGGSTTMTATTAGREWQVGPIQFAAVRWDIATIDIQGAATALVCTLPATASGVTQNSSTGQAIGSFQLVDLSTPANSISGTVYLASSTTARFRQETGTSVTDDTPFVLAVGDVLTMNVWYPVA